jgi:hypothetical protein
MCGYDSLEKLATLARLADFFFFLFFVGWLIISDKL